MKEEIYDVVILGAGSAGLTAAIYSKRYARKAIVIANSIGGNISLAGDIENWPGTKKITGTELTQNFYEQAKCLGTEFLIETITDIKKEKGIFNVTLKSKKTIKGKTLILAFGTKHKELEIPGEKQFIGKGVSYCATCDGMFFKNKKVVVIGGNDSAAKAALYLSEIAKEVIILYRKQELRCEAIYCKRIKEKINIKTIFNAIPEEIIGNAKVTGIKITENKKEKIIDCDGIFIEIGALPCNTLSKNLGIKCDNQGYIITDKTAKTNIEGVWAAGDITNNVLKQVVTASAEGAIAANQVHEFLQRG